MSLFVDTSALYALLVGSDRGHARVRAAFEQALREGTGLLTTSYALVETTTLLQHRIGLDAVRDLDRSLAPVLDVEWISPQVHAKAMKRLLRESRREVSLVDWVSFEVMRGSGISRALTLDRHFGDEGFEVVPPPA
ncbi:MAG: PIN domain-containing protein [Deltaproteobacteria bacterium]|nr:PIN domain-containing protein [Deltaproteobacteria bacterium]